MENTEHNGCIGHPINNALMAETGAPDVTATVDGAAPASVDQVVVSLEDGGHNGDVAMGAEALEELDDVCERVIAVAVGTVEKVDRIDAKLDRVLAHLGIV